MKKSVGEMSVTKSGKESVGNMESDGSEAQCDFDIL